MLTYIIKLLWRRKERLALVLAGILLVSFAASVAAATARSTQGTVDAELARHWRSDYDLVIRHPDTVSTLEEELGALPGNFQSNQDGTVGITEEQLAEIRAVAGVEVAAPMTMLGYCSVGIHDRYEDLNLPAGIYQRVQTLAEDNGYGEVVRTTGDYMLVGRINDPEPDIDLSRYGNYNPEIPFWNQAVSMAGMNYGVIDFATSYFYMMATAIDPEAEAELTGLDQATSGTYLNPDEPWEKVDDRVRWQAIANRDVGLGTEVTTEYRLVEGLEPSAETVLEALEHPYGAYVASYPTTHWDEREMDLAPIRSQNFNGAWLTYPLGSGLVYDRETDCSLAARAWAVEEGFYQFDPNASPSFGMRMEMSDSQFLFREFGTPLADDLFLSIEGYFDSEELNIFPAESPVSAPMELYRYNPGRVKEHVQVPVRGSGELKPSHPLGFGGAPNGILVHMDLARELRGEDYIDSVRVRVAGVEDMNERSQVRIAAVAELIRESTGLHVDVVLGSSNMAVDVELQKYDNRQRQEYRQQVAETMNELIPELEAATGHKIVWDFGAFPFDMDRVLVNVPTLAEDGDKIYRQAQAILESGLQSVLDTPEFEHGDEQGWYRDILYIIIPDYQISDSEDRDLLAVVEETWIQLGTQMRIYQETNRGTFWITIGLLLVSALFIGNTTYISVLGRTRELSVLRSLGWKRGTVMRSSLAEISLLAFVAGVVTALVLWAVWQFSGRYLEPWFVALAIPAVMLTFFLGSLPPLLGISRINLLTGIKSGEVDAGAAVGGAGRGGFVLRGLLARPGRASVTLFALTVPGCIFAFIIFVYFGVQQVLGETLLGEYLALQLEGYHYLLNALAFAIAGLAVADTLLVNLRERQNEFGLLKALGWRSQAVANLLFAEGICLGLAGGVLGTALAGGLYAFVFGMVPSAWLHFLWLPLVPALVAAIASLVPVARALRLSAAQWIKEI